MDTAMTYVAPRTCTVVNEGEETRGTKARAAPLSDYANAAAYVLIARTGCRQDNGIRDRGSKAGGCVRHSPELSDLRRQAGVA